MAFGDFEYPDVLTDFGLTFDNVDDLFAGVPPVPISAGLRQSLPMAIQLATAVNTEKARSEWMVAPLLADFWGRYHGRVGLYSGATFNPDPDAGLSGVCDFLICLGPQQVVVVTPPVLVAFEAKNESISGGLGQCVAAMVGAQRFNRRRPPGVPVFGCVTTGSVWRFLRLTDATLTLGLREYGIGEVDQLLGILMYIAGPPPAVAA